MRTSSAILIATTSAALLCWTGCESETPTGAIIQNGYPVASDATNSSPGVTIYKAWYFTTAFVDPVAPGGLSDTQRTVPATDYVYAVLAPGWDPSGAEPPTTLIPVRSKGRLSAARGGILTIDVSDATFDGNCMAGSSLSQDDADFITQRIFPGQFASVAYDAKTCRATPVSTDAGAPDGGDGAEAGAAGDAALDAADSGR